LQSPVAIPTSRARERLLSDTNRGARILVQLINATTSLEEARATLGNSYDLKFTKAVEKATAGIFDRLQRAVPAIEWPLLAPLIFQINRQKKKRNAVILAHRYQAPPIFFGVADLTGDTLALARAAARDKRDIVVQCGVRFMAETTKLLNPQKTVLIPDSRAGCSLADSITPADVLAMRARYPGVPVIAHLSSPASVKAVSDVCCTPDNALAIVEAMAGDTVIMVPDEFLARNVARHTGKKIIAWAGGCEVHQSFTAEDIAELRAAHPGAKILAHPECAPAVVAAVDFTGSLSGMIDWVKTEKPPRVVLVTECSLADNLAAETPDTEFLHGCNTCPHMKQITLEKILWSLHTMSEEVVVAPDLIDPAAAAIRRMTELAASDD